MSAILERARRGEPLADLDIIDMHGHLGRYAFDIPELSPAALVADMDRLGVRRIVCGHLSCIRGDVAGGNEEVLRACRAHPGRIQGYVTVWPSSAEDVAAEVESRLEAEEFVGVKLHNSNQFAYTDAAYAPALAVANERRMPVLFHTWADDEEFAQLRKLAQEYPEATLLLAHAGAARPEEYAAIAREVANVYLDTSFSQAPRGLIAQLLAEAGAEKVVWGSDAIFLNQAQQLGRALGAEISDEDRLKLLSGNARRLLGRIRR